MEETVEVERTKEEEEAPEEGAAQEEAEARRAKLASLAKQIQARQAPQSREALRAKQAALLKSKILNHKSSRMAEERKSAGIQMEARAPNHSAATQPLPSPWQQHFSEEYDLPYFWNAETGEAAWERPT